MLFRKYGELDTLERLPMANARVVYKTSGLDKGAFKYIYFRREQPLDGFSDSTHDYILRKVAEADALRATDNRYQYADKDVRMDSMGYYARFARLADDVLAGIADASDPEALFEKYLRSNGRKPRDEHETLGDEVWGSDTLPGLSDTEERWDDGSGRIEPNGAYRVMTFQQLYDLDRHGRPIERHGRAGDFVKGAIRSLNRGVFHKYGRKPLEDIKAHHFALYARSRYAREERAQALEDIRPEQVVIKRETPEEDAFDQVTDDEDEASRRHVQTPVQTPIIKTETREEEFDHTSDEEDNHPKERVVIKTETPEEDAFDQVTDDEDEAPQQPHEKIEVKVRCSSPVASPKRTPTRRSRRLAKRSRRR